MGRSLDGSAPCKKYAVKKILAASLSSFLILSVPVQDSYERILWPSLNECWADTQSNGDLDVSYSSDTGFAVDGEGV